MVIEVSVRTLDAESGLPQPVRLIKIDTEGADIRVLKGAQRLIERDRPTIVLEFSPRWIAQLGDSAEWIQSFATDKKYSLYRLDRNGPKLLTTLPTDQIDLLCTPQPLSEGEGWTGLAKRN